MEMFELLYSKTHEWLGVVEEQDIAYIGISNFAAKQLSDIVYIDLPFVGKKLIKDQPFGEIESVKAVNDLFAPINGEVIEINQSVLDDPTLLLDNEDPWLVKIWKINDPDVSHLLSQGQYDEQVKDV